jgi:tetratricopeptide (TPR) repeat protein
VVIAALWAEADEDALDDAIGELLRRSLLDYDEATEHYSQHDFLRDIARQRCPALAAEVAHERHARHFCRLANAADDLYRQGGENVLRGLALFDANLAHIVAGQAWAIGRAGAEELAIDYALNSPFVLSLRLHPRMQIMWMEAAHAASQTVGDLYGEGVALSNIGNAYYSLGEIERAISFYEQDLEMARIIGDQRGEGNSLGNMGLAYAALGEVEQAIGFYEQGLEIVRAIGDRRGEGAALGNLTKVWARWHAPLTSTSKDLRLCGLSVTGAAKVRSWAIWGLPTKVWARWHGPLTFTSSSLRSRGPLEICVAKPMSWVTSGMPTKVWVKWHGPLVSTSK